MPERTKYKLEDIVDVNGPRFAIRNYLEQKDLRCILSECSRIKKLETACEVGCGFGRMTVVLSEFCNHIDGFEREIEFVDIARRLIPGIDFHNVITLDNLGAKEAFYDLILTFTVLQHISDSDVEKIALELKRILKPGGFIILCEETDPGHVYGNTENFDGFCTIGRSVSRYTEIMRALRLVKTFPRRIEPGYSRQDVGTYMVFES